jgi:plastocyanin
MKSAIGWLVVAAGLGFGGVSTWADGARTKPDETAAANRSVTVMDFAFKPQSLEVFVGDSVLWVNQGKALHTATSDDKGKTFDTGKVPPGEKSKAFKFEKVGTFKYHCALHPKMVGEIVVRQR